MEAQARSILAESRNGRSADCSNGFSKARRGYGASSASNRTNGGRVLDSVSMNSSNSSFRNTGSTWGGAKLSRRTPDGARVGFSAAELRTKLGPGAIAKAAVTPGTREASRGGSSRQSPSKSPKACTGLPYALSLHAGASRGRSSRLSESRSSFGGPCRADGQRPFAFPFKRHAIA